MNQPNTRQYSIVITEAQRRILQAVCAEADQDLVDRLDRETPVLRHIDGERINAALEVQRLRAMFACIAND